ncbi:MAG: nitroreductase family protein [Planctomycetota bacterium]
MAEHQQPHRPYAAHDPGVTPGEAARAFYDVARTRRSVREFSDRPVPRRVIESIVAAAGTAPSGANKQPWRFVAVSDPDLKRRIRAAAEAEEREFYSGRAGDEWLKDLEPFETHPVKAFLETAPWLIVCFRLQQGDDGSKVYYGQESMGIAVGMLLTAVHQAGLAALTHTPSPMRFLQTVLGRPEHERAYLLIPVGYPAEDCQVPDIERKRLEEILVVLDGADGANGADGDAPAA